MPNEHAVNSAALLVRLEQTFTRLGDALVPDFVVTGQPHLEWPSLIEHNLRQSYTRVAEEFDPEFTPPPEVLAGLRIRPALGKALREYYAASRANA